MKNDEDPTLCKNLSKAAHNNMKYTDEEGWTTTSPGRKKLKKKNKATSMESIITLIDGNFDEIITGIHNRIYVTSPGRKYKCNIPDNKYTAIELEFNPTITMTTNGIGTENEKAQRKEGPQDDGKETSNANE
jgi:hypothetical protein